MVTFLLFVIACGVGYLIFSQNQRALPARQEPKQLYSKDELRIENVGAGGVLKLTSVGPNMEDFDVNIVSRHTYHEGEYTWYELEGDRGDDKVWITLEEDDEVELSIVTKKLKMRDLGITSEQLTEFDDEEDGEFQFEGEPFYYEESDRAVFYRHSNDKDAEQFYYWEFENEEGTKYLSVEKWSDGKYDVSLSYPVKLSQVTVYSNGAPS